MKRLWAESDRGAGTIVGGERSKGGLWIVRRGEVNNCYPESEYRSYNKSAVFEAAWVMTKEKVASGTCAGPPDSDTAR